MMPSLQELLMTSVSESSPWPSSSAHLIFVSSNISKPSHIKKASSEMQPVSSAAQTVTGLIVEPGS